MTYEDALIQQAILGESWVTLDLSGKEELYILKAKDMQQYTPANLLTHIIDHHNCELDSYDFAFEVMEEFYREVGEMIAEDLERKKSQLLYESELTCDPDFIGDLQWEAAYHAKHYSA